MIAGNKLRNRNKLHNALKSSDWDLIPNMLALSIMYILHAAFSLALFHHYRTFGDNPDCNSAARAFIFGTHTVTNKWFIGLAIAYGIVLSVIFIPIILKLLFLAVLLMLLRKPRNEEERQEAARQHEHIRKLVCHISSIVVYLTNDQIIFF
jgi:hypothetical protein